MKRYTLKVGQSVRLRSGLLNNHALAYAGMPSNSVYSVVVAWSFGHNSMAYNLFLQERQRQFHAAKGKISVHNVSPEEISFSYEN